MTSKMVYLYRGISIGPVVQVLKESLKRFPKLRNVSFGIEIE